MALQLEAAALPGTLQHAGQLVHGEGLRKIIAGAQPDRLNRRGDGGKGGHHHDGRPRPHLPDLFEQSQAAGGHLQVHQDHVHGVGAHGRTRLVGRVGGMHGKAHSRGNLAAGLQQGQIVIQHQQLHPFHAGHGMERLRCRGAAQHLRCLTAAQGTASGNGSGFFGRCLPVLGDRNRFCTGFTGKLAHPARYVHAVFGV